MSNVKNINLYNYKLKDRFEDKYHDKLSVLIDSRVEKDKRLSHTESIRFNRIPNVTDQLKFFTLIVH